MTRPLIRKSDGYWRIYIGHSRYCLPDYFTNLHTAASAASHIRTTKKGNT